MSKKDVLVVIGAGGIGQAIARRQGSGKIVLLADINDDTLASAAKGLQAAGHDVTTQRVDVSSRESVHSLASAAAELGSIVQLVDTAGLSPVQASPSAILKVDLLGVALILEEFGFVIASGGAGVVISSMAGYMPAPLPPEQEEALVHPRRRAAPVTLASGRCCAELWSCLRAIQACQPPSSPGG